MATPLLSTVIPTFCRPQYLRRAVSSALEGMGDEVEVIVVPNGPDDSWKKSMAAFSNDQRIRIEPVATAHANVARNHGLASARGKYVRFLDDDDYLLPNATNQLQSLETTQAEICSGRLEAIDQNGIAYGLVSFPNLTDFASAAVGHSGFILPTGNVFLRSALHGSHWDPRVNRSQDYAWMIDLAALRDWHWIHENSPVGVWFQHDGERISSVAAMSGREEAIITRLISLHETLNQLDRINARREAAIAAALWHYAHKGFPYHPLYWRKVALKAVFISPLSRPDSFEYQHGILSRLPPVTAECVLAPLRRLTRAYRDFQSRIRGRDYRRRL